MITGSAVLLQLRPKFIETTNIFQTYVIIHTSTGKQHFVSRITRTDVQYVPLPRIFLGRHQRDRREAQPTRSIYFDTLIFCRALARRGTLDVPLVSPR